MEDELVLELRQCRNHNGTKVFHLAKHVLPIFGQMWLLNWAHSCVYPSSSQSLRGDRTADVFQ